MLFSGVHLKELPLVQGGKRFVLCLREVLLLGDKFIHSFCLVKMCLRWTILQKTVLILKDLRLITLCNFGKYHCSTSRNPTLVLGAGLLILQAFHAVLQYFLYLISAGYNFHTRSSYKKPAHTNLCANHAYEGFPHKSVIIFLKISISVFVCIKQVNLEVTIRTNKCIVCTYVRKHWLIYVVFSIIW